MGTRLIEEASVSSLKSTTFLLLVIGELQAVRNKDAMMSGRKLLIMSKLYYEKLVLGDLATNCYIVWEKETKEAVIIDPADDGVGIADEIQRLHLIPKMVAVTHGHFDHALAGLDVKLIFNIPFGCSCKDKFLLDRQDKTVEHFLGAREAPPNFKEVDIDLNQIDEIKLGKEKIKIIKTPGHTPGGVCFYHQDTGILITGDLIGGDTRHKYSSITDMTLNMAKLKELPLETLVLPGHDDEFELAAVF